MSVKSQNQNEEVQDAKDQDSSKSKNKEDQEAQDQDSAQFKNNDEESSIEDSDVESLHKEQDMQNEKVKQSLDIKNKILEEQEDDALEKLVLQYGSERVCFDCITGYESEKSFKKHIKTKHSFEGKAQGIGSFICQICDQLLDTKKGLERHINKVHPEKKQGKQKKLTVRQQNLVSSYSSQSQKKQSFLKKYIQKNKKNQK